MMISIVTALNDDPSSGIHGDVARKLAILKCNADAVHKLGLSLALTMGFLLALAKRSSAQQQQLRGVAMTSWLLCHGVVEVWPCMTRLHPGW
jgi:hypothetical protein